MRYMGRLNYKDAMKLLSRGNPVKRAGWKGYIMMRRIPLNPDADSDFWKNYIDVYIEVYNGERQYIPKIKDINANDWEAL